jgi:hypothetical protein
MRKAKKIKTVCVTSILLFTMLGITTTVSAGENGNGGDPGGLTPGYWKNHIDDWVDLAPSDKLVDIFGPNDLPDELENKDLLEALRFKGGKGELGAARILLRAAVAGLLNWKFFDDDFDPEWYYPIDYFDLIEDVNDALATGDRDVMLDLKDILDDHNNLGL